MPQHTRAVGGTSVLLTDNNVTECRVQNASSSVMLVQGTVGATPPANYEGALYLWPGQGELVEMAKMFPGVIGANRLYARSEFGGTLASVSYA
jgi:hypothetical protein